MYIANVAVLLYIYILLQIYTVTYFIIKLGVSTAEHECVNTSSAVLTPGVLTPLPVCQHLAQMDLNQPEVY